ncbi:MAG: response regulator [Deltaproteobacteria bacterium]|nr:response regulator [Deltaproteobacteria bacterium]
MDKPYKLLIIDDNEETLTMLHSFFSKKNYEVASSLSGLDGLKLFESDKKGFDLVITDLVMPNISGVAVISIIKKKNPDTPVIAITGWGEHPESLASEANADLILSKPLQFDELEVFVLDLLTKKIGLDT